MNRFFPIAAGAALLLLATSDYALAQTPASESPDATALHSSQDADEGGPPNPDPAESTNRGIFAGNQFVDDHLLKPAARAYEANVPDGVRHSLHNFVANLGEPSVLVNDLLQGNAGRAWTTTRRFVVNTTVGGAGLFDPATDWNLPYHDADFGQTFGVWGAGPGPDVQLPFFGFSNIRDTAGLALGAVANPLGQFSGGAATGVRSAAMGVGAVDSRAEALPATDTLQRSSVDYYATLRSVSAQRRAKLIEEGRSGEDLQSP